MHVGIAGEFRCVVTKEDGTVKEDTGYQKNLILNQGLDFFGGNRGAFINNSCVIGVGNSTPIITQTQLDSFVAIAASSNTSSSYNYVDEGDNLYKIWEQKKYRFTGLNNVNISEVGLVSQGGASDYYLTTRALIKDDAGSPVSISIKTGETLDIYYKIHKVIDVSDKVFSVNMLDGVGASVPYSAVVRPSFVGDSGKNSVSSSTNLVNTVVAAYTGGLGAITSTPLNHIGDFYVLQISSYTPSSYKRELTIQLGLNDANTGVRCVMPFYDFASFQIRYGSVSNDSPIPKDSTKTLSIPIEISWGRYEGAL